MSTDPETLAATAARWVGQRMPRLEDQRMITGHGRYIDDLNKPGTVHATFVRSTVARGRIVDLDVSEARQAPGVIAVLTAAEVPDLEYGHVVTPGLSPGGHKGLGEGGAIASPAALVNAVRDALAPLGVSVNSQPLTPDRILGLIEEAGQRGS